MSENKQYILIPFEEGNLIFKDDGREFFNSVDCLKDNEIVDLLNKQDNEIRELQERNDRQRKRLDNLYQLILNRDYTGQEELIKELEESERLLQEEMECYSDSND